MFIYLLGKVEYSSYDYEPFWTVVGVFTEKSSAEKAMQSAIIQHCTNMTPRRKAGWERDETLGPVDDFKIVQTSTDSVFDLNTKIPQYWDNLADNKSSRIR